jgi:HSP20 family protein
MATGSTRWHPFAEREDLHGRSDRMLAEMESGERRKWSLAVDIIERGDEYLLRADVPGIEADEIKIEVENDVLTVSAEYEESEEEEKDNYLRRERRYGSASRSITLPKGVTPDQIQRPARTASLRSASPRPMRRNAKRSRLRRRRPDRPASRCGRWV